MDFSTWPRLFVVDTEGNGATPPDLVELAAVPVVRGRVHVPGIRSSLVRPPTPISPMATRVHRLTDRDVAAAPGWPQIAARVRSDLDGRWIAAHNAGVDHRILARHLPGWAPAGVVDTLRLARACRPDLPRHTLDALLAAVPVDPARIPGSRHRAVYDAHATALVLLHLAEGYATWDDLARVAVPPRLPGTPGEDGRTPCGDRRQRLLGAGGGQGRGPADLRW
ncbi:exonuclease domain-containing protein [Kitasatospora sp. NPDC093550]|uniref:3'-5' exonuclease n=1 Tax=Kitasatospora sp. NPDC093550 TaxID=3364089 RepID=UPI00381BD626